MLQEGGVGGGDGGAGLCRALGWPSSASSDTAGAALRRQRMLGEEDEANKGEERWPERALAT